jgi:hypothetical protein
LNLQYWLITYSNTLEQNTGMVWSFFIWMISPKMVLSTSWWCSVVEHALLVGVGTVIGCKALHAHLSSGLLVQTA